jgi:hypothetical protein
MKIKNTEIKIRKDRKLTGEKTGLIVEVIKGRTVRKVNFHTGHRKIKFSKHEMLF